MYKLICMSFDGEYQIERPTFKEIEDAQEHSNNLGSKWFFYPFHFVIDEDTQKVVAVPDLMLDHYLDTKLSIVAKDFKYRSELPEMQGVGIEEFLLSF